MKKILSQTQMQYVHLIILFGLSKKEIASTLNKSVYTVETQIKNIYAKLGFNKITELAAAYYADEFNISELINSKKKEIVSTLMCFFIIFSIGLDKQIIRVNRRYRRKIETEIIVTNPVTVHGQK